MPTYLVTYTSMLIDADTEMEAIERAPERGGGNWEAEEVNLTATATVNDPTEFALSEAVNRMRTALAIQAQSDRERMVTPDEAVELVRDSARALLAALGEE